MSRVYKHLTQEQRYEIEMMYNQGASCRTIGAAIGVSPSTISREIHRNSGQRGYRHKQAHRKAVERVSRSGKMLKFKDDLLKRVENMLIEDWSPEQISLLLSKEGISISHERIYQHIWRDKLASGTLYQHLRQSRKKYRKRRTGKELRGHIPHRRSIDERPKEVGTRASIGHWEGDTVIGKAHKGALVTLVERASRFTLIAAVANKNAASVTAAVIALLSPYKQQVHSITFDNGKEFAYHTAIAEQLDANVYFAHPYSSWERGTNENTNGLIRQYFPKERELDNVQQHEIDKAMMRLNNRPRKILNAKTPSQVFSTPCTTVALDS